MDIIMPNMDGVSATAMIRLSSPEVPVVAMTSNIRQDDIQTYFNFGKFFSLPAHATHLVAPV
jgi:osomolarity two-component system response regulator SKN7